MSELNADGATTGAARPSPAPSVPPDDFDARLDEALQETFPASDPIAVSVTKN